MGTPAEKARRLGQPPSQDGDSDVNAPRQRRTRLTGGSEGTLKPDSPLLGGPLASDDEQDRSSEKRPYEIHPDVYEFPNHPERQPELQDLSGLVGKVDPTRDVDDWGRSERVYQWAEPILNFYYRYWFRVEIEGIENVPSEGGALLVSNHSGALPPDAPMIMQAIRNEHSNPRPLYMLGEHWFKGYPMVGMLANKIGMVPAHPANAVRLLRDEGNLAIVFPEGQKGTRKLYWQRYRLRRFGRGGFVSTAMRARVSIVPVAVMGAEEAMPIFAHLRLLQKMTGLIYFPFNHAFPQFGLAAAAMYLPAKFKIRFLEPISFADYGPDAAGDVALVQKWSDEIRTRIQRALEDMLRHRNSIWFG